MSELILAVDPGCEFSAYVFWDGARVVEHDKVVNQELLDAITTCTPGLFNVLVIEKIASYGMAVGAEVFETVFWSGRFAQAALTAGKDVHRLPRMDVKMHLCHSSRAKDGNIRQALIDRLGPPGTKKAPGATYGISGDCWAALAVAVTFADSRQAVEV